jgi:hypothetical protein
VRPTTLALWGIAPVGPTGGCDASQLVSIPTVKQTLSARMKPEPVFTTIPLHGVFSKRTKMF